MQSIITEPDPTKDGATELLSQILQQLQKQTFLLEQLNDRLAQAALQKPEEDTLVKKERTYPPLLPIQSVSMLKTKTERLAWWNALEDQWKRAFNASFFQQEEVLKIPSDAELVELFQASTLRIVGASAMHPSIHYTLTNCSGLQQLTNLKQLFLTHHDFTNLSGLEYLTQLNTLFCNSNRIDDLTALHYLPQLEKLYCMDNQITTLAPLATLTQLQLLNCSNNVLENLQGLKTQKNLQNLIVSPNPKLSRKEIQRIEDIMNIRCQ